MNRQKTISHRLLLAALVVGLNALCFLGVWHGPHVTRHTRVNYSHVTACGTGRGGSRNGRLKLAAAVGSPTDHVAAVHVSQARLVKGTVAGPVVAHSGAIASSAALLPRPEDNVEPLLARENVLALGSAPRAPGLGRAPPVA